MQAHNDNIPAPEAARVLPILGRVASDGRLVLARPLAAPPIGHEGGPANDPREA